MFIKQHAAESVKYCVFLPQAFPRTCRADPESGAAVPEAPGQPCGAGPAGGGWHPRQGPDSSPQQGCGHSVWHAWPSRGADQHWPAFPAVL